MIIDNVQITARECSGDNPNRKQIWWRCFLSGRNGERLNNMRLTERVNVSATGIATTQSAREGGSPCLLVVWV